VNRVGIDTLRMVSVSYQARRKRGPRININMLNRSAQKLRFWVPAPLPCSPYVPGGTSLTPDRAKSVDDVVVEREEIDRVMCHECIAGNENQPSWAAAEHFGVGCRFTS
jgi:hypothetical protein